MPFRIFASLLMLCWPALLFAADRNEDAEAMALVSFVLDVTTYEGMYFSVHDFCATNTSPVVSRLSKNMWLAKNKDLLSARDTMEQRYLSIMRGRGVETEAHNKLQEVKKNTYSRAHDHPRLYKDLLPLKDKYLACSKRLGEMVSESMSFQAIAPDSYRYWHEGIKP